MWAACPGYRCRVAFGQLGLGAAQLEGQAGAGNYWSTVLGALAGGGGEDVSVSVDYGEIRSAAATDSGCANRECRILG